MAMRQLPRFSFLFSLIFICALTGRAQTAPTSTSAEWIEFSSPDGRFSILLPGQPQQQSRAVGKGKEKSEIHSFVLKAGDSFLHIAYENDPSAPPQPDGLLSSPETVKFVVPELVKGKMHSRTDIKLSGYPGSEISGEATYRTGGKDYLVGFKARTYIVGPYTYTLLIAIPKTEIGTQESRAASDLLIAKFFDSFRLLVSTRPAPQPLRDELSGSPPPGVIRVSGGVLQGALAIKKVSPSYPAEAKAAGVTGLVKIRVLISEEGKLLEAEVMSGPELLREPALEAARQWTFRPMKEGGKAVKAEGVLTFNFTLQ